LTYPHGSIFINPDTREIFGSNPERQDFIIAPLSTPAKHWSGYFCPRFDQPFASWGVSQNNTLFDGQTSGNGTLLSGYATFSPEVMEVSVRIGVSFISVEQARKNLDIEIPDGNMLEDTAASTRSAWAEKLELIKIKGASKDQLQTFYTAFFHTLQADFFSVHRDSMMLTYPFSILTNRANMASTTQDTMMLCIRECHIPDTRTG
jgi:hypothetical protein